MRSSEHWWSAHRWAVHDGLHHAVLIFDGGYLMEAEASIACTGEREPRDLKVEDGVPTCVACWAMVLT